VDLGRPLRWGRRERRFLPSRVLGKPLERHRSRADPLESRPVPNP
jgi:hypothetical protein